MKENTPKKTWFQTLRTLWVPLAIGVVTVAALAVVVGAVWKDYRTALMDSQTRQMELVVQSTADSIRVLLEEYADRLDSIAERAEASKAFRPTVARSDTIRDVWLENSNGEVIYSCYGLSAVCDVLITRAENISYWQYHSGDEHYLVMKKKAGDETACLVVDSTVMYQQLISEIHIGRNGYIMIKNDDNLVVMHPEAVQWGIEVVEGVKRERGTETAAHRTAARWFYGLISKAAKTDLRSSSDFKLLDRKAVLVLLNLPERNTFYRALSAWVGFRTARVEFDVQPRTAGQSSWSTFSLIRYAISSLASFTSAPLYLVILMGFLMLIATLLVGGEALFRYFAGEALEGFTTVILLQLFTGTLLMFSLGIIGYYLA